MIEKISLVIANESGDFIEVDSNGKLEVKIDVAVAESFSRICAGMNSIENEPTKNAEKFNFALYLKNYERRINENYDRAGNQ